MIAIKRKPEPGAVDIRNILCSPRVLCGWENEERNTDSKDLYAQMHRSCLKEEKKSNNNRKTSGMATSFAYK